MANTIRKKRIGNFNYLKANSININPENDIKIKPPKNQKIITQQQANSIIKELYEKN